MATTLEFSQVLFYVFDKNTAQIDTTFTVPADKIYKIESAGLSGSNGTIFLRNDFGNPDDPNTTRIAMLYTSIATTAVQGSPLPYTLPAGFTGNLFVDTDNVATVSITEYSIVT